MITQQLERPQQGPGDFHDVVTVEFCDGGSDLFGFLRVARAPSEGTTSVIALLYADGEAAINTVEGSIPVDLTAWDAAEAGPAKLSTIEPLAHWTAALELGDNGFEITLEATTPPLELVDDELSEAAGVHQYEQLCRVHGRVRIGGSARSLDCKGRRVHVWGAPDWSAVESRRSLYAALPDRGGVSILTARPANAPGHDAEHSAGYMIPAPAGGEPVSLDEILLSTVYDQEHLPDSAGVELYLEGEEYAHRASGTAMSKTQFDVGGRRHQISFFRWSIDGDLGWGSYQTISPL